MRKSIFRGRRPLCFLEVATVRPPPSSRFSLFPPPPPSLSLSLSLSVSLIPRACSRFVIRLPPLPPPAIASPEPIGDESVTRLRDATNERRRARSPFQPSSCFSRVSLIVEFRASPRFCSPFAYPLAVARAYARQEEKRRGFCKQINPFNHLPASTFHRIAKLECHLSERRRQRGSALVSRLHRILSHTSRILNPHRSLVKSRD